MEQVCPSFADRMTHEEIIDTLHNKEQYMRRIAAVIIAVFIMGQSAFCEYNKMAVPDHSIYKDDDVSIVYETQIPKLDRAIRCVALGSDKVAIRCGSSEKKGSIIIVVYDYAGGFLGAYDIHVKYERGVGPVFFNEDNELCCLLSYTPSHRDSLITRKVFKLGTDECTFYSVSDYDDVESAVLSYQQNKEILCSKSSGAVYDIFSCSSAKLRVMKPDIGVPITVFDITEAYNEYTKQNNMKGWCGAAVLVAAALVLLVVLSKLKDKQS